MGGFSLGSMICGKKGCRDRPHASMPHASFPTYPSVSGGKWCDVRSQALLEGGILGADLVCGFMLKD